MHVARGLVREANLPVERAALSPSGSIFPMEALGMPTIRKSLLDPVVTKQSPTTRLLQAARETIASYPAGVTTIYTDGSVRTLEGTVKAGYGAVVRLSGNPESDELSGPCQQKSSLEAELEAMFQALDWVATMNVFISQERKSEARRRSDTVVVLTINYATWPSAGVASMTLRAASGKPKVLGSGGSMVAKLKLKGIDGRAPPGVEPAA
nr:colorectal mutant cancer protein-like [Biomphalaria glabrata]